MLFNSLVFFIFLPLVFFLHWFLFKNSRSGQNLILLFASYVFYAWWDYWFLMLLIFSTALDYFSGLMIFSAKSLSKKRFWLVLSISINLGFLGLFKYYNFFIDSLESAFNSLGWKTDFYSLSVILPVGISFYTFHGLSYVIDIFYSRIKPSKNWTQYSLFVSYFPLLVAGPIERANHLLPQLVKKRIFNPDFAFVAFKLMLWGLFKKIVVADNLAPSVNEIFGNYGNYNSDVLFLGALLFSIQIYCDFSGYSDIARGVSRLFGIELLINFNFPYFSKSISEFWKKWHISLSSWFRDYLYIPMGGSRISKVVTLRNVLVVFLVSGFWHGANWTFIAWGLIHAILFLPSVFHFDIKPESITKNELIKVFISTIKILSTFFLVTLAWIFFRSPSCGDAFGYLKGMCNLEMTSELFHFLNPYDNQNLLKEYLFVFILFISEMVYLKFGKHKVLNSFLFECAFCAFLIISIILNVPLNSQNSFIYFQF